jgi:peptidoglycan/xylan/chitin deacetylase (PgdA/CDA1 family)
MRLRWDRIGLLAVFLFAVIVATVSTVNAQDDSQDGSQKATAKTAAAPVQKTAAEKPTAAAQPASTAGPSGCPAAADAAPVHSAPLPATGGAPTGRTVALTFDDGPSRWTPAVLEVLREEHVPATFFMIGKQVAANPHTVAEVAAGGNLIGNHTWSHQPPSVATGWPVAALTGEVSRTVTALRSVTHQNTCWFRPPDGILKGVAAITRPHGISIALWSVDTEDWKVQNGVSSDPHGRLSRSIAVRAIAGAEQDHPVILLHDGGGYRGASVAALPSIIAFYRAAGYTFVRLDGR